MRSTVPSKICLNETGKKKKNLGRKEHNLNVPLVSFFPCDVL